MAPPKNDKKDDLLKMDLYKLMNIPEDATQKQVKKAYRKKALECHPDKNPDNPKAAETFHQLAEALKILSDVGARAAYDHVRKAKKAAQERTNKLDAKRRKVKLDLEAREQAAEVVERRQAKTTLKQQIDRLREEGSRILEEEQIRMREQLKQERLAAESSLKHTNQAARLKLKWKSKKDDFSNGGYSAELLNRMFSKYCDVTALILSKKPGNAVIELENSKAARLALSAELGLPLNPLKIVWISGDVADSSAPSSSEDETRKRPAGGVGESNSRPRAETAPTSFPPSSGRGDDGEDFELAVLMRLKRAQEKKRQEAGEGSSAT